MGGGAGGAGGGETRKRRVDGGGCGAGLRGDAAAGPQALVDDEPEAVLVALAERQVGEAARVPFAAAEVEVDVLELAVQRARVAAAAVELREALAPRRALQRLGALDLGRGAAPRRARLVGGLERFDEPQGTG